MKLVCLFLCVAFTSYTVAQTLHDIDLAVVEIEKQVEMNARKYDELLDIQPWANSILGKLESIETSIMVSVEGIHNKVNILNKLINGTLGTPCNCLDIKSHGTTTSGVQYVYAASEAIQVYCDMATDGGGWLVFQRRKDGTVDFHRNWNSYKRGFGNVTGEFWLGNEYLYQILNSCGKQYELRIDLQNFNRRWRYAKYSTFKISSEEDSYRLSVHGYSGTAGDSLWDGEQFTTRDRDTDKGANVGCSTSFKGAWWYNFEACHQSNLNGLYLWGRHPSNQDGVEWFSWMGNEESLKTTEMKIRPKK